MNLDEALRQVDDLTDMMHTPIDPGIRLVVAGLHMHTIATYASCEGHIDHGYAYPWVDVGQLVHNPETDREVVVGNRAYVAQLAELIEAYYVAHPEISADDRLELQPGGTMGDARLQPTQATAIEKFSKTDKLTRLKQCQADMQAFADYLIAQAK